MIYRLYNAPFATEARTGGRGNLPVARDFSADFIHGSVRIGIRQWNWRIHSWKTKLRHRLANEPYRVTRSSNDVCDDTHSAPWVFQFRGSSNDHDPIGTLFETISGVRPLGWLAIEKLATAWDANISRTVPFQRRSNRLGNERCPTQRRRRVTRLSPKLS